MKYKVEIWERDRWSGPSLDSTKEFDTKEERDAFIKEYNKGNTLPQAPDWYMVAQAAN